MKKTITVIAIILLLALVIGAVYFFRKSSGTSTTTTAVNQTDETSGLSSLLGKLNLSGLTLFGAG